MKTLCPKCLAHNSDFLNSIVSYALYLLGRRWQDRRWVGRRRLLHQWPGSRKPRPSPWGLRFLRHSGDVWRSAENETPLWPSRDCAWPRRRWWSYGVGWERLEPGERWTKQDQAAENSWEKIINENRQEKARKTNYKNHWPTKHSLFPFAMKMSLLY